MALGLISDLSAQYIRPPDSKMSSKKKKGLLLNALAIQFIYATPNENVCTLKRVCDTEV